MNLELLDELCVLIDSQKLDEAIATAEEKLRRVPDTDFHKILGKNLLHLAPSLANYIADFEKCSTVELKKKRGFIKSILSSKKGLKPVAFYGEMNGFTINYDRWYIELYAYKRYSEDDWNWLSDFYDCSSDNDFTITGFEEIQAAFRDVHENDMFEEPNIDYAYEVCELLVILRLQQLFRHAYIDIEEDLKAIPMFVCAHDYDFTYRAN